MVGLFHDGFSHERWRPYAFECRDAARPLFRSVHARSVELNDAVRVRRAAVANTTFLGVELVDIHPRDERVEDVVAPHDHREGLLDARLRPAVLVAVAIRRRDDHRLDALGSRYPQGPARRRGLAQSPRLPRRRRSVRTHDE